MSIPKASTSSTPLKASLSIGFIVIGGGLSGLTAAYALARSGHRVTVLEKSNFDYVNDGEACRMPPNMSKVYFRWGYEEYVRRISVKSTMTLFSRYEQDDYLGSHFWEEEYLSDTGGDFIFAHNSDLRYLSYQLAVESGAIIRPNCEVVYIDVEQQSVTLSSGEVLSATVIIGADGLHGISRATLLDGQPERYTPTGLVMYSGLVRGNDVRANAELSRLWDAPNLYVSCGHMRASLAFPLGSDEDYAIQVYAPDPGLQSDPTLTEFKDAIGHTKSSVRKCVELATRISRTPVEDRPDLEDWVHDDYPFLLIGGAAHPMPPGAIQTSGLAVEDAGVLGKLFSHLTNFDQVQSFLYAFQDLRQQRCSTIVKQELAIVYLITMPDGEAQEARDTGMKANTQKGLSVFAGDDSQMAEQWENNRITFGYDPEDDADNWWLEWGRLRERAKESGIECSDIKDC